ncbi:hypothetical protein FKP32DRAFT_630323 [Trametes sanguinea]|nr:hypothetical protein FKP32DRAFT_630323 [Trametes sanguinea]
MRVFSTLVASTLLAGIAAALPRPETDAAGLVKRTDSYGSSGYSGSGSGSGSYSGSDSSSGSYSGSSSSSGSYSGSSSSSGSYSGSSSNSGSYSGSGSGSGSYSGSGSNSGSYSGSGSNSGYSGSGSNSGCSNGSCDSSSSSSTMMNDNSSTMMASSTMMYSQATQTADMTSTAATSTMTYGSGSTNWGGSGYNDCVQQCIASYGPPAASYTPPTQTQGSSSGSSGSGTTHTVIVAPTQGVLRYVPFAVNASVGDTVMFMWGANNHTVTKSSMVEICNKTDSQPFASGEQNKPFTFTQVVNDTNPIFFYCGTPGHCQKGMFGMINGPSAYNAPTSVGQMMGGAVNSSSDMAAMMAYTDRMTANNTKAANWGANLDMASVPSELHEVFLQNVMYTRAFLGANPEVLKDDGSIDLNSHGAPMKLPTDMATVNNAVDSQPSAQAAASTGAAAAPAGSSAASSAASPAATGKSNGAASTAASSALLGVAAFAAAVLAF